MDQAVHGELSRESPLCPKGLVVFAIFASIAEAAAVLIFCLVLLGITQPYSVPETAIQRPSWADSTVSYYEDALGNGRQGLCEPLEASLRDFDGVVVLPAENMTLDDFSEVFAAVLYDNPDIFWVSTSYRYLYLEGSSFPLVFFPQYNMDKEQAQELHSVYMAEAQDIALDARRSKAGTRNSDYITAKNLYLEVSRNISYGYNSQDQNISAFFDNVLGLPSTTGGQAVCAGYSKTMKVLCDAAGLDCCIVRGSLFGATASSHAWNLVETENGVVFADTTWGSREEPLEEVGEDAIWFSARARFYENSHMPDETCLTFPLVFEWREQAAQQDDGVDALLEAMPDMKSEKPTYSNLWMFRLEDVLATTDGSCTPETLDEWRELFEEDDAFERYSSR